MTELDKAQSLAELPAFGPKTRAAIGAAILDHETALEGTSPAGVGKLLTLFKPAFPRMNVDDTEASMKLEHYEAALSDIPPDILNRAMQKAVKTISFFPTVKEIRELAAAEMNRRAYRLLQLRYMADRHDRTEASDSPPITDEQQREVDRILNANASVAA